MKRRIFFLLPLLLLLISCTSKFLYKSVTFNKDENYSWNSEILSRVNRGTKTLFHVVGVETYIDTFIDFDELNFLDHSKSDLRFEFDEVEERYLLIPENSSKVMPANILEESRYNCEIKNMEKNNIYDLSLNSVYCLLSSEKRLVIFEIEEFNERGWIVINYLTSEIMDK